MKKTALLLLLISISNLFLLSSCGSSKGLQEEFQSSQMATDSTVTALEERLKDFSTEVQAMRETYNEDHKTLEDLYRLNAESKSNMEQMVSNVDTKVTELSSEQARMDSIQQIKMLRIDSTNLALRQSMSNMKDALAVTQFQVDSMYAMVQPEHLNELENNLLEVQSQFSRLDSSILEYQLGVNDQVMATNADLRTLEQHARVQDSANYDILSQLVLLENKIISLTNAFNELMAMPPGEVQPTSPTPTPTQASGTGKLDYETYKQHYIDALSNYQNREFLAAIDQFQMLLRNDPSHDYADNAQYWIGESYYALEDYDRAVEEFRKVLNFTDTNKADAAQFKIGYSYINMGDKTRGFQELQRVIDLFPDSPYLDRVREILATG